MAQELAEAVSYFLSTLLYLQKGDRFLIYTDDDDGDATAGAMQIIARNSGIDTDILDLRSIPNHQPREAALTERIALGSYTAACELSLQYYYPSSAWKTAAEKGCRIYALGPMDEASFVRCIGKVDHQKTYAFGLRLQGMLRQSHSVRILSESGTDIACRMSSQSLLDKIGQSFRLRPSSRIWNPSGVLHERRGMTFLSGQLAFLGLKNSIEGKIVIDGYLWPPDGIGQLDEPIVLTIVKGEVTAIDGSGLKSSILRDWLSGKETSLEHFCLGFNPSARLGKNMVEAERAFGHICIGFGKYPFHTDGILQNPTLVLDDTIILEDHSYLQEELQALSKELTLT